MLPSVVGGVVDLSLVGEVGIGVGETALVAVVPNGHGSRDFQDEEDGRESGTKGDADDAEREALFGRSDIRPASEEAEAEREIDNVGSTLRVGRLDDRLLESLALS